MQKNKDFQLFSALFSFLERETERKNTEIMIAIFYGHLYTYHLNYSVAGCKYMRKKKKCFCLK